MDLVGLLIEAASACTAQRVADSGGVEEAVVLPQHFAMSPGTWTYEAEPSVTEDGEDEACEVSVAAAAPLVPASDRSTDGAASVRSFVYYETSIEEAVQSNCTAEALKHAQSGFSFSDCVVCNHESIAAQLTSSGVTANEEEVEESVKLVTTKILAEPEPQADASAADPIPESDIAEGATSMEETEEYMPQATTEVFQEPEPQPEANASVVDPILESDNVGGCSSNSGSSSSSSNWSSSSSTLGSTR